MMSEVCKDTEIEPKLIPLSGEELQDETSNNSNKESVDIRSPVFWERVQQTFFGSWIFNPNVCRCGNKSLQQCYVMNEQEKKQAYNERILKADHGTWYKKRVPKVLLAFGAKQSQKRNPPLSISSNCIRTKVSFGLLKSNLLCLRGREQHAEKQRNLKLTLMYLTFSPKYNIDNNH